MGTQSTACVGNVVSQSACDVCVFVVQGKPYEVIEDLVPDDARHLEALLACNRIDDHVAMDTNEVLRVKNAILILVNVALVSKVHMSAPQSLNSSFSKALRTTSAIAIPIAHSSKLKCIVAKLSPVRESN